MVGIGLNSIGRQAEAIDVLEQAWTRFPGDYDIGWALATMHRDAGDNDTALRYIDALMDAFPDDQNLEVLRQSLIAG